MRVVTVVGHRGDPYVARENTLPSLRAAIERGADAVEVDVRLTRDGVPVLLHDDTLNRLWGHDLPLSRLSHARLGELTGGGVPTLAAAVAAAGGHRLMLDLPGADASSVRAVVGAVREGGADDRVYYTGGPAGMLAVRDADPDAEIALTWTTLAPPRPVLLAALRPRWLNYRFGLVSRELAEEVHAQGYLLSVWTADTRAAMRRLVARGVDSITTNRVDALKRVLGGPRKGAAGPGRGS
ncbi:glycerophosphodiester phosphodiesterase [Streptomyces spongiicola]|uniref:Glycerophosphodiester phosphodiesterase n=1 Tax=Streptomyces spongiicola TaxID=1690221 RepID=A0A2S1Z4Z2_9ACTN|nr:glycerophosphodiester phosphodiesterase [Streptomyces spongiicola]AWK11437.1 glycerophosphodiester phosphodiesterase [Streptomyces spongiicola]GBQ01456.1 glycerophosphodiester phosphodiesterase [Streptomyces spongiicola]